MTTTNKIDGFTALAEPNRRRIMEIIAVKGEVSAKEISDQFTISAPAISQHLKVLREADLVSMERRAQQRIYSLNPDGVDEMWKWLKQVRAFWNVRADRLEKTGMPLKQPANRQSSGPRHENRDRKVS